MKHSIKFLMIGLMLFAGSCSDEPMDSQLLNRSQDQFLKKTVKSTVDLFNPVYGTQPGTSTLHRNANGLTVNYKTSGLKPGYAYTLWWVIWNNPENCNTPNQCNDGDFAIADLVNVELMYAAGHVIGDDGIGNFSSRLKEGNDEGSINHIFGLPPAGGLQIGNSYGAEVHVVLRNHGPAVPGMVNDQINTYLGGCEVDLGAFVEDSDEVGECSDIEFGIHPPVGI